MDWPNNLPEDVVQKMRELYRNGTPKDYYGATFFGGTGWFESDRLLHAHEERGWKPTFQGDPS